MLIHKGQCSGVIFILAALAVLRIPLEALKSANIFVMKLN